MALTMDRILKKFPECNVFSLTGSMRYFNTEKYKELYNKKNGKIDSEEFEKCYEEYIITEEEYDNALNSIKKKNKELLKKMYDNETLIDNKEFEELYSDIENECYEFIKNKTKGYIVDKVGDTTKYGKNNKYFFYTFYSRVSLLIDKEIERKKYSFNGVINPTDKIPEELKENLLRYEMSFENPVISLGSLKINYYFILNNETKKYLLKYKSDFDLEELEDLALYKDNELKFYSCTHEEYNSIKLNYKDMNDKDLLDFINDEYRDEESDNNKIIFETIKKIINFNIDEEFSFKSLGINNKGIMNDICNICEKINLNMFSKEESKKEWVRYDVDGKIRKVKYLPASLCEIDTRLKKE